MFFFRNISVSIINAATTLLFSLSIINWSGSQKGHFANVEGTAPMLGDTYVSKGTNALQWIIHPE